MLFHLPAKDLRYAALRTTRYTPVLCEFQLLQMQIKSIYHQIKRYMNRL